MRQILQFIDLLLVGVIAASSFYGLTGVFGLLDLESGLKNFSGLVAFLITITFVMRLEKIGAALRNWGEWTKDRMSIEPEPEGKFPGDTRTAPNPEIESTKESE